MTNPSLKYQLFVKRFSDALSRAQRILIATHTNPDGDALASIAACMKVFSGRVPSCSSLADGYSGEYLSQLPFLNRIYTTSRDVDVDSYDLVVLVDAHSTRRSSLPPLKNQLRLFAVDHHPFEGGVHDSNAWIDVEYPSTTAMLTELFRGLGERIDEVTANILLCGIVTDTELFKNHAANHLAFRIAGTLVSLGADVTTMKRFGLRSVEFETVKAAGKILEHIQASARYRTGVVIIDEHSKSKSVLTSIVKRARLPETMFVIKPNFSNNWVEVSMRSYNKNVGVLARMLGGGGHPRAAAFRVTGTMVEQDGQISIL